LNTEAWPRNADTRLAIHALVQQHRGVLMAQGVAAVRPAGWHARRLQSGAPLTVEGVLFTTRHSASSRWGQ
jgi:hypothetical protein